LNHYASGDTLAMVSYSNSMNGQPFPALYFDRSAVLRSGSIYHLVFLNSDPAPKTNYVSINNLHTLNVEEPRQPTTDKLNWAVILGSMISGPNGTSTILFSGESRTMTPICQVTYSNGISEGIGYIDAWSGTVRPISGSQRVREQFRVPSSRYTIGGIGIRLRHVLGTSPLVTSIRDSSGSQLAQAIVEASQTRSQTSWVFADFGQSVSIEATKLYYLEISTLSDAQYALFPLQKGTSLYGFDPQVVYSNGYAEYSDGSVWQGWVQTGTSQPREDTDLQYLLFTQ
jgi:hypothetical protein